MNKLLPFFVLSIFVFSGLGAVFADELDQYQTDFEEGCWGPIGNIPYNESMNDVALAQSFIPTKEILTRVELLAGKNVTTTYPLTVGIRDNLSHGNLVEIDVEPSEFLDFPEFSWVEFDFDNLMVDIGEIYYIVASTSNATDNWYILTANCSNVYPDGSAYISYDGGETWEVPPEEADACFKTYGQSNAAPDTPIISGPTEGRAGIEYEWTFVTIDPDGDDVYYYIHWNDTIGGEWIGPYPSGEGVTVSHIFAEAGIYNIIAKAKDIFGEESSWSEYYPVNITINTAPNAPHVSGATQGTAGTEYKYTFIAIDPEGDQVYYKINWGIGNIVDWFGPFESGEPQILSHSWEEQGNYIISAQAKDVYEAESEWGQLRVTMPRNHASYRSFLQSIYYHLKIFPIFQLLLQLLLK